MFVWQLFCVISVFAETIQGPFPPDEGLLHFKEATKRQTYFTEPPENWYEKGQCTWFVRAVREDEPFPVPRGKGNAWQWFSHFEKAGYATGREPVSGAIAVWNQAVAGCGHVALVTEVFQDGSFMVWDSNWGLDLKVRARKVTARQNMTGFIYWPNGRDEPPTPPLPPSPVLPSFPSGIVFDGQDEQGHWLYSVSPSGSEPERCLDLNQLGVLFFDICFSPDKQEIVFVKQDEDLDCSCLYALNTKTGELRRLIPKYREKQILVQKKDEKTWRVPNYYQPEISPSGLWIVFNQRIDECCQKKDEGSSNTISSSVWISDRNGENARPLPGLEEGAGDPCWLADGRISSYLKGSIVVYDPENQNLTRFPLLEKGRSSFKWSPMVDKVAFLLNEPEPYNSLCAVKPFGQDEKVVFSPKKRIVDYDWSEDGSEIVAVVRTAPSGLLVYGSWKETGEPVKFSEYEFELVKVNVETLGLRVVTVIKGKRINWIKWLKD